MKLDDVKTGEQVVIQRLVCEGSMKKKLLDMGLIPHTKVLVRKVAPLGDPMELLLRGYALSIRKAEAAYIEVA